MTNADIIRNMTDEELRKFICSHTACRVCDFNFINGCALEKWLKEEV